MISPRFDVTQRRSFILQLRTPRLIVGCLIGLLSAVSSGADEPRATVETSTTASTSASGSATTPGYRIERSSENSLSPVYQIYHISRGDRAIATYHADLKGTPGFYPLLSPSGLPLTRNFPMEPATEHNPNAKAAASFEKKDHDHHRSMWFNHGEVNGLDFWVDDPGPKTGRIVQKRGGTESSSFATSLNGVETTKNTCTIQTTNEWQSPESERVLRDEREFRFGEHLGDTVIDVTVRLIADDQPVTFGDTKEGTFGIRVAGTMKVDAKLGGVVHNAEGFKNNDAWSKASAWVDYSGPIAPADLPASDRKMTAEDAADWPRAGITMMYHPDNKIDECRWHVRSYGLFAANPFGRHHFGLPGYDGVKIEKGETLTLHFRVVLHDGGFDLDKAAEHFKAYAETDVR